MESAKSRGLHGNMGYVGCVGQLVRGLRKSIFYVGYVSYWVNILLESLILLDLRELKMFLRESKFFGKVKILYFVWFSFLFCVDQLLFRV